MHKIAFVITCLACATQGRRMQSSLQQPPRRQRDNQQALIALETLLRTDDVAAAFNSFVPGAHVSASKGFSHRAPMMSSNDQLETADASNTKDSALRTSGASRRSIAAAALASALAVSPLTPDLAAQAKELPSGAGSPVNKDPLALLRFALPNQPKEMGSILKDLEAARYNLEKRNLVQAVGAVNGAVGGFNKGSAALQKAVPSASAPAAEALLKGISTDMGLLSQATTSENYGVGKEKVNSILEDMGRLGELIATGYKQSPPPAQYKGVPYLKGRASIDLTLKRPGGKFDVLGTVYDQIDLTMVVDGYRAPLTAGNFVDLVNKGFFNGFPIQRSDGFVIQTGDPTKAGVPEAFKSKQTGYVPQGETKARRIPLEVFVQGDKEAIYEATFDDDGRGGQPAALPFNAYGSLGMAREEDDLKSASSQFFWLLYDSDLTPAGKNLLDGYYSCFGMTTKNANLLADVKEGDMIVTAKVTGGLENLVTNS
mmetsp:Transcript_40079/g.70543  ORF Transcript_40079/g.70543 Transcript_40079/m.70543 type:complete len:485 (-) Transcript_40079:161-1615(-)